MKRNPPSQSTRRSFSLSEDLTVSNLTKRITATIPIAQKGRLIQKAHLQVAFSACNQCQWAFLTSVSRGAETHKDASNERTEDRADRPRNEDKRKPFGSLPERNDIGEDDLSSNNNAATSNSLNTAASEQYGKTSGNCANYRSNGEE